MSTTNQAERIVARLLTESRTPRSNFRKRLHTEYRFVPVRELAYSRDRKKRILQLIRDGKLDAYDIHGSLIDISHVDSDKEICNLVVSVNIVVGLTRINKKKLFAKKPK